MAKDINIKLLLFIIAILLLCIILRLFPTIQLSNVNDKQNTLREVEVKREYLDTKKYKNKKKYTIIDGVVYEKITDEDLKNPTPIKIIKQGTVDIQIDEPCNNSYEWTNIESSDSNLIIDKEIDEFRSK